jgi:hypothetical protein
MFKLAKLDLMGNAGAMCYKYAAQRYETRQNAMK